MPEDANKVELYNLNKDPTERNNMVGNVLLSVVLVSGCLLHWKFIHGEYT